MVILRNYILYEKKSSFQKWIKKFILKVHGMNG